MYISVTNKPWQPLGSSRNGTGRLPGYQRNGKPNYRNDFQGAIFGSPDLIQVALDGKFAMRLPWYRSYIHRTPEKDPDAWHTEKTGYMGMPHIRVRG